MFDPDQRGDRRAEQHDALPVSVRRNRAAGSAGCASTPSRPRRVFLRAPPCARRSLSGRVQRRPVPWISTACWIGRPVDPRDQRLRDAAERAEADGVEARLVAVAAGLLADGRRR